MTDALYPTATGAIPTLVALYAQLKLHRAPEPGSRFITLLVAFGCPVGFIAALTAVLRNINLSHWWREVVIWSIVLPAAWIGLTVARMAVTYPWPLGQLDRLIDKGEAPRFYLPELSRRLDEQRMVQICKKLGIDPDHPDPDEARLFPPNRKL